MLRLSYLTETGSIIQRQSQKTIKTATSRGRVRLHAKTWFCEVEGAESRFVNIPGAPTLLFLEIAFFQGSCLKAIILSDLWQCNVRTKCEASIALFLPRV